MVNIVTEESMYIKLSQEFRQDTLFKLISNMGLEEELFDEHMEGLSIAKEYSTTDFEQWYCNDPEDEKYLANPSTMRSWQKQLNSYIEAYLSGRNIVRMNYQSVFRLRMLLLLRNHSVSLQRVSEMLGIKSAQPHVMQQRETSTSVSDQTSSDRELDMFKSLVGQMLSSGIVKVENGVPVLHIEDYVKNLVKEEGQTLLQGKDERFESIHNRLEAYEDHLKELQSIQQTNTEKNVAKIEELISKIQTEEDWEEHKNLISELRKDTEARDKVLTQQLRRQFKQNKIEMYNSLPFFVKWFYKKEDLQRDMDQNEDTDKK